jgi:glycosyltransferase involved in cell wall biosynthesis
VHPPFDIRIFHKECRTLAAAGYDVVFVVPHEHDEVVNDVRVRAVSKPRGRLDRPRKIIWEVLRAAIAEDADLYHFHDPELVLVGLLLKARGKKVIYDVHENAPEDILTKAYLPKPLRHLLSRVVAVIEGIGAQAFDGIVPVTAHIAKRFPVEKTMVIQNFPILSELAEAAKRPYQERANAALYVGIISAERGVLEMVRAMPLVNPKHGCRLHLVGNFVPLTLEAQAREESDWAQTEFHGHQPRDRVASLLADSRIGLVLFHPGPNHTDAQPNKLFEYMAAGVPLVASDFPRWRELIEPFDCGLLVDPLDPSAIAKAIEWLLEHPQVAEEMGKRGQRAAEEVYNWEREGQKLVNFYQRILSK